MIKNALIRLRDFILTALANVAKVFLEGGAGVKWDGNTEPHDPLAKRRNKRSKELNRKVS